MRHWSLEGAIERVIQISRIWEDRAAVAKTKFHGKHLVIAAGFPASDLIGLERIWIGWSEFGSDWIWIGSEVLEIWIGLGNWSSRSSNGYTRFGSGEVGEGNYQTPPVFNK